MYGLLLVLISVLPEAYIFTDPPNCPPCRRLEVELDAIKADITDIKISKFLPTPEVNKVWKIEAVPTIIVVEQTPTGVVELRRHKGFMERGPLREFLKRRR